MNDDLETLIEKARSLLDEASNNSRRDAESQVRHWEAIGGATYYLDRARAILRRKQAA